MNEKLNEVNLKIDKLLIRLENESTCGYFDGKSIINIMSDYINLYCEKIKILAEIERSDEKNFDC